MNVIIMTVRIVAMDGAIHNFTSSVSAAKVMKTRLMFQMMIVMHTVKQFDCAKALIGSTGDVLLTKVFVELD